MGCLARKPNADGTCPALEGRRRDFQGAHAESGCDDSYWKVKGSSQVISRESKEQPRELPWIQGELPKMEFLSSDLPRDRETWSDLPGEPINAPTKLMLFT